MGEIDVYICMRAGNVCVWVGGEMLTPNRGHLLL